MRYRLLHPRIAPVSEHAYSFHSVYTCVTRPCRTIVARSLPVPRGSSRSICSTARDACWLSTSALCERRCARRVGAFPSRSTPWWCSPTTFTPSGPCRKATAISRCGGASSKSGSPGRFQKANGSARGAKRGERGIWQRRYWEHLIRDERDHAHHIDYCWFNPVKHGLVASPTWRIGRTRRSIAATATIQGRAISQDSRRPLQPTPDPTDRAATASVAKRRVQ